MQVEQDLQNKLNSILNWVEEAAKQAGDLVVEQTPLYIQELLAWNFWYSLIWFTIFLITLLVGLNCLRIIVKSKQDFWADENINKAVPTIFGGIICLIVGLVGISFSDFEWLQIAVAPRVWLVEYVSSKL